MTQHKEPKDTPVKQEPDKENPDKGTRDPKLPADESGPSRSALDDPDHPLHHLRNA